MNSTMNFYENIVGMLTGESAGFLLELPAYFANALATKILLNFMFFLLILIFVFKKIQNEQIDLKLFMQLTLFVTYVGFFNWAIANPKIYVEYFEALVRYPADLITTKVAEAINAKIGKIAELGGGISKGLSVLMHSTFQIITEILFRVFGNFSLATIGVSILQIFLSIVLVFFQGGFLLLIMLIVTTTAIEIVFWLGSSILILPLMFFKETRGMLAVYLKKIFALTLYKPFIFCLAFFNFSIIDTLILQMPNDDQIKSNILDRLYNILSSDFQSTVSFTSFLIVMIISSFLVFMLAKKIPDFINGFFGVSGGVGDISSFIQQGATKVSSAMMGGAAGAVGAKIGNAYDKAGGGLGGLSSGMLSTLTGGVFGGSKMGEGINKAINSTKGGSKFNDAITKGVEFGSKYFGGKK